MKLIARIAVLEIEWQRREPAGSRAAYERPGLMLDFAQTDAVQDLAKKLEAAL